MQIFFYYDNQIDKYKLKLNSIQITFISTTKLVVRLGKMPDYFPLPSGRPQLAMHI